MLILIERDPATRTPKTVADEDEARTFLAHGRVFVQPTDDAGQPNGEPVELLPVEPEAEEGAANPAAKKSGKAKA